MKRSVWYLVAMGVLLFVFSLGAREVLRGAAISSQNDVSDGEFSVHEWGTFTTFSGSDGVYLDFRPLAGAESDLPNYVLDRGSHSKALTSLFAKSRLRGRVRMETPVTYFYSDRVRTIDVSVEFPDGLLTEFYPPVRQVLPAVDEENIFGEGEKIGQSSLSWGKIDLIPTNQLVHLPADANLQQMIASNITHALVPHAANEQHYASARETDSALIHVRNAQDTQSYFEKFLFYRGVGKFELPITAEFVGDQTVIRNRGNSPIRSCILIDIDGDQITATKLDHVEAGQSASFAKLQRMTQEQLSALVQTSLVDEGLYVKEAASMVETWKQSWFAENGMRVLYMLPADTTDKLLPLRITPRPQATLRVLVGRMEVMSPEDERAMVQAVEQSAAARRLHDERQSKAKKEKAYPIPDSISRFGRMTEPALARVAQLTSDSQIRNEAELLIRTLQSLE